MDPGCTVCLSSFRNQLKNTDFINSHAVYIMLYVIKNDDGTPKFRNSELLANYYYALLLSGTGEKSPYHGLSLKLINRLYTGQSQDGQGYQYLFDNVYDNAAAEKTIKSWLKEWKLTDAQIETITKKASSDEVKNHINKIREKIETEIKPKGIPTMLYNGTKHLGLYK